MPRLIVCTAILLGFAAQTPAMAQDAVAQNAVAKDQARADSALIAPAIVGGSEAEIAEFPWRLPFPIWGK